MNIRSIKIQFLGKNNHQTDKDENRLIRVVFGRLFYLQHFLMRKKPIVNKKRPVNLDLSTMKFPPMAIASILHRISGILLFILLPVMLYILGQSLQSADSFSQMKTMISSPVYKLVLWAFSASLAYHVLAGIRHILMDMGYGEHLEAGRRTSILVIVLAVISTIILGIWIW
jgi:succinate dehydrogenase / fumarate reductase cytochrome b subunit